MAQGRSQCGRTALARLARAWPTEHRRNAAWRPAAAMTPRALAIKRGVGGAGDPPDAH